MNSSNPAQLLHEVILSPDFSPALGEKPHNFGSNQLLKRPTASEPLGVRETFRYLGQTGKSIWSGHIIKVRIADPRLLIPEVHGVYGLSQFGAAGLVDTTSIDPEIMEVILIRDLSTIFDLLETGLPSDLLETRLLPSGLVKHILI